MFRSAIILCWAACTLPGASLLEQRIEHELRTAAAIAPASVGIHIVQIGTGKTIFSLNADKLFVPASNTKLFSTSLALSRLGPDHKMTTRVLAGAPDASGRVSGDLVLAGSGDPSMSFLPVPYDKDAEPADPMAAIEKLADDVVAKGVRSVSGDIIGDDTAYLWEPFPPGWGLQDPVWEYGAPVSALNLGSNSVMVRFIPAEHDGDPAEIDMVPRFEYLTIDNRTRTVPGSQGDLSVHRLGPRLLQITGTVARKEKQDPLWLAVDDPALYAATAFMDALTRRGVRVDGTAVARHRYDDSSPPSIMGLTALAVRDSPPLSELIRVVDKVSQNLWAELMLREVSRARSGVGSRRGGLEELEVFLKETGIAKEDYTFADGSGLSRLGLVKPEAVVQLLRKMYASPLRETWVGALPVGGQDGTLEKRFGKDPAAKAIHAKTGSLTHVNALSGYADSATYGELAFSIMVNNSSAPAKEVREFIDRIGMFLLE